MGHIAAKKFILVDDGTILELPLRIEVGSYGWAETAWSFAAEGFPIILICPKTGRSVGINSLHPRRPMWGQIKQALREAGIECPPTAKMP